MCLPPKPCHITFLNFFFNRSALRFSLYLHWLILLCKCISPGLLLEIPLDFFSISVAIVIVGLYIFIFFIIYFLGECLVSVFKNRLARRGLDKGTLAKANLSVLMSLADSI